MKCKKDVQNSLSGYLFFSLSFSLLSSLIGASCIFFYRLLYFLLRAHSGPILLSVDILLFFFYISFSFFWFLRIFLVVLFGRAKECAALGLITPSKGTGGELRLRNSLWPDFWNSWPRETRCGLPPELDCSWITDISNGRWRNRGSISSFYRWTMDTWTSQTTPNVSEFLPFDSRNFFSFKSTRYCFTFNFRHQKYRRLTALNLLIKVKL